MARKGTVEGAARSQEQSTQASPIPAQTQRNQGAESRGDGADSSAQNLSNDEIAARAYQIFERDGRVDGRDMDHWLRAERELREEQEQRQQNSQQSPRETDRLGTNASASRPPRADEAPRSARRHQPSMAS